MEKLPTDKRTGEPLSPINKRRVSAKVRTALAIRVKQAKTWDACAEAAGLSSQAVYKAIRQPHVAALFEQIKQEYVQQIETLKDVHKARALDVARDLLDNSRSEQVKARMVEFLRGEAGRAAVNVQINNNNIGSGGYEYAPPGSRIVDITPEQETDRGSGAPDNQAIDK